MKAQNLNELGLTLVQHLQNHPEDLKAKMDLAYVYSEGQEWNRAVALYEEVLKVSPQELRSVNELCYLYTALQNKKKAYHYCTQLSVLNPDSYLSFDNLGLSYYKFGDFLKALKAFKKAETLIQKQELKEWGAVQLHIGKVILALKDFDLAKNYFLSKGEALRSDPTTDETHAMMDYGLYEAYKGLKQWPLALEAILKTYNATQNPLYLGPVTKAFIKKWEFLFFGLGAFIILGLSHYLGKRLNRFLRNEMDS